MGQAVMLHPEKAAEKWDIIYFLTLIVLLLLQFKGKPFSHYAIHLHKTHIHSAPVICTYKHDDYSLFETSFRISHLDLRYFLQ